MKKKNTVSSYGRKGKFETCEERTHEFLSRESIDDKSFWLNESEKSAMVIPYLFENHWILALESGWMSVFNGKLSFRVFLKNGRLFIVSEQCLE